MRQNVAKIWFRRSNPWIAADWEGKDVTTNKKLISLTCKEVVIRN
jgi:hypothetical protein